VKAIECRSVTKTFKSGALGRRVTALKDISFQLEEGEDLAVIGPSPSGKTTLLKLIAGIYRPDEGDILMFGKSVVRDLGWARRNTYYISQQMQLNKKLTVREEISYFQALFKNPISRECVEMLEIVGLGEKDYGRRIETLSETQTTVLKVVLGLIKKPKIMLMDNALGEIDQKIIEDFTDVLNSIEGLTIIIVDRNINLLNRVCEKAMILVDGKLMDIGRVKDILSDYPYKYDVEVAWKHGVDENEIAKLGYPYQKVGGMVRYYLRNEAELRGIMENIIGEMGKIMQVQVSGIDLEDIYYWKIYPKQLNEKNK
jgi:ABC-type multidrug transport system ATPase subunit